MSNNYEILVVSQFTLYAILKGNKPDFHAAKEPTQAEALYNMFVDRLKSTYSPDKVQTGKFGELMAVESINDGPVTIQLDCEPDKGNNNNNSKAKINKAI